MAMIRVGTVMRPMGDPRCATRESCAGLIVQGMYVRVSASLDAALPIFDGADIEFLPVLAQDDAAEETEVLGALYHVDALKAYNRALAATAAEEHS
jgi:chloride channel protein, CIC family